ncbi:unnamed protein product [Rhizoctonia solani]|uniref:Zn(2)-C6 fungal-type domain-containing protein n=1 Tax=Rhizoctonia solani TaxID=456999 RepID=A0A8H3GJ13_9AGAM|nr:unnamed protein product [Rhizoctonia solani]
MSTSLPPRSNTGCLTCKTRRKKCDETKPKCLRCQRLGVDCPGYIYVPSENKSLQRLRTLPAPPRINAPITSTAENPTFHTSFVPGVDSSFGAPRHAYSDYLYATDPPWAGCPMGESGLSVIPDPGTDLLTGNYSQIPDQQTLGMPSAIMDHNQLGFLLGDIDSLPMTSGQASLFQALMGLGQPQDASSQLPTPNGKLNTPMTGLVGTPQSWPTSDVEDQAEFGVNDEDPEGAITVISRMPVLDPTVESNALPFVLQNYATWITFTAFEPLKMTSVARDMVFSHFGAGDESRDTLTLLAKIGGTIARTNGIDSEHTVMLSALQNNVFRQVSIVRGTTDREIKLLEVALEAMTIHYYVSPITQAERLRRAIAPIFRALYPGPLGAPINLRSLMSQPLFCLRYYAYLDIISSSLVGFSMMFRYDTTSPSDETIYEFQAENSPQWLFGVPDRLIVLFARINTIREDGSIPSTDIVREIEQDIREFRPFQSVSTDSYLVVTRLVVQECWRQIAYVYLYMALCGESAQGSRVESAMKQLMKLVNGTKPGRFPDNFLATGFMMVAPVARTAYDRQTLTHRIAAQTTESRQGGIADNIRIIEDCWARADAEGRPVVWSDVSISRIRVVGV